MRPYLLKGHQRPLNFLKYNREGDLLVSCAKDHKPCLWFSEDGYRVGTFNGHNGAVWTCDFTFDSQRLITASADSSVKLWDVETGADQFTFKFQEPCRAVSLSVGDRKAAMSTDPFMAEASAIHIVNIADDVADQKATVTRKLQGPKGRISRLQWTDQNKVLVSTSEDGYIRRWDVETGKLLLENRIHDGDIRDMKASQDGTHFITSSTDKTAKVVDALDLTVLKEFQFDRPANTADMSPIADHVVIGGGQEASAVTTTSSKAGGFQSRFFHKIYQEEFGNVRGHFGPVNAIAYHPDGHSFVTGGEDGYVRINHFDSGYLGLLNREVL
jgi:translation initiation factor 3 subunit I